MPVATVEDLARALEQLQAQMAAMSKHIEFLEHGNGVSGRTVAAPSQPAAAPAHVEPVPAAITEEELLAISAALGAYLGVRAHIRQIRLGRTSAMSMAPCAPIQASHRLP